MQRGSLVRIDKKNVEVRTKRYKLAIEVVKKVAFEKLYTKLERGTGT